VACAGRLSPGLAPAECFSTSSVAGGHFVSQCGSMKMLTFIGNT
jgi:hypothetical protein